MTATLLADSLAPPARLDVARDALFLDLDGTLAPIAAKPSDVVPDARRSRLLADLMHALDGRLAVVSGRHLQDIDRILGEVRTPVGAVHGLVLRTQGGTTTAPCEPDKLARARRVLGEFAAADSRLLLEDKAISLALHYRQAPDRARDAAGIVEGLAREFGWIFQPGRAVAELRPPGADKGEVVRRLMRQAPFVGARPVFVGDDATDEDGFVAAADLGGFGVRVDRRAPTAALFGLPGVAAVLDWLEASLP